MAGTTTNFAIPYPTGTDRVADGDNAMQALAERVDAVLYGAAWEVVGAAGKPPFQNSYVNMGVGFPAMSYRRIGDRVDLVGWIKSGTTGLTAFTLPVGYRPLSTAPTRPVIVSGGGIGYLDIFVSGEVKPTGNTSQYIAIDTSFYISLPPL